VYFSRISLIYLLQIFRTTNNLYSVFGHQRGDKVRIKNGEFRGARGVLVRAQDGKWIVSLARHNRRILVGAESWTNYSLAARRAWQSMPDRKVGRPAGSKVSYRISVIFRVDRMLWQEFLGAEEAGLIGDRTGVINHCLRTILNTAKRLRPKAS